MRNRFTQVLLLVLITTLVRAQVTNSSIGGIVKGANNEPLVGATVTATHVPTGTVYTVASRAQGRYDIENMKPGGPYTIVVSFVGFTQETRNDVNLNLGEKTRMDVALADASGALSEVVVASRRAGAGAAKGGVETNISQDRIRNMPTVTRSLNDYIRLTPQAKITGDGGISLAGQNNRFNAFYIDGAINNDVFGIAASGTNGGQANINPISVDAIDQFQVVLSPYDASLGGFTGGGINAITRSGTNTYTGSVWIYYRNEDLAGKTPGDVPKDQRTKLADLRNITTGFRIGGPIVKNKAFFFLLGELQRDRRPQPFDVSTYRGTTKSPQLDDLRNTLISRYKYDPGGYLDNPEEVNADRITAKIDWNVHTNHKLSVSYRYNNGERFNTSSSSTNTINYYNNGYIFPSKSHTGTAELRSNFGKGMSNRLLATYTNVLDNRDPLGDPFPRVTINDGSGTIVFGTENFSTGNLLRQKNWTVNDVFRYSVGKHVVSVGTDNLFNYSYNVFIRDLFGTYTYNNLNDFLTDAKPRRYQRSFSLLDDAKDEESTEAAAELNYLNLAFFVNDEYKVGENLTLNFGLRADKTIFPDEPREDPFFNDTALPKITQYYDMRGARSGQKTIVPWSLSPRFGFTYRLPDENITVRGGLGLFTGRMPLVWPGGVYNNTGVSIGGIDLNPPTASQNITFRPDPFNQYTAEDFGISLANAKGQVDLMEEKFRLPRVFRTTLGVDKKLGQGWTVSVEGIFTKNIEEIYYNNVNILPPALKSTDPGSRNVYAVDSTGSGASKRYISTSKRIPMRANGSNPYTGVFLLFNNPDEKGYSYNFTVSGDKAFRNGLSLNASYTYGNSVVTNENTSSQNNSQWRFMEVVNGRNFLPRTTSDFDLGHRIVAYASKRFSYGNNRFATTVTLNYNGQQGQPFSWVYRNSMVGDDGFTSSNDLLYIPTAAEVQTMLFDNVTVSNVVYTQAQQRQMLEDYIQGREYLKEHRGEFAERNEDRLPWQHIIDLGIKQDFNVKIGSRNYSLQLTYDVYNFTNMLNRDWGRTYFLQNDNYALITFNGFVSPTNLTPKFQFTPQTGDPYGLSTSTQPGLSARWISQVGARINF